MPSMPGSGTCVPLVEPVLLPLVEPVLVEVLEPVLLPLVEPVLVEVLVLELVELLVLPVHFFLHQPPEVLPHQVAEAGAAVMAAVASATAMMDFLIMEDPQLVERRLLKLCQHPSQWPCQPQFSAGFKG